VLERIVDLVGELATPNRVASLSGAGRVSRLHHEAFDVAVEQVVVVVVGRAEGKKVLENVARCLFEEIVLVSYFKMSF
jgi:hypothetical protein